MDRETLKKSKSVGSAGASKNVRPHFIVLDANVLIADYWLRSVSSVLLKDFLTKTNATLVVPKVVFEEVVNHHEEDVKQVKSDLRRTLSNAGRLVRNVRGQEAWIEAISKQSRDEPYRIFLLEELKRLNAMIVDYSDISHSDVVARDLRRRRPFQQSGKGYRDTLLWETILRNCIKENVVTVFITDNVRDFCDSAGELHADLKSDLGTKRAPRDSLVLFRDLPAFTDALVVPYLTKRKDFALLVRTNKVEGLNLESVCEQYYDTLSETLPSVTFGDHDEYEHEVDVIEDIRDFHVKEASEISDNVLLVLFEFRAHVSFTYFLRKSDYATTPDEAAMEIAIIDSDWNEDVMQVESTWPLRVECRFTFNSEEREVESFEVEGAEVVK
jgi:hypothetical protein